MKNLMVTLVHDQTALDRIIRWAELLLVILLAVALARLVADLVPPLPVAADLPAVTPSQSSGPQADGLAVSDRLSPALTGLFGIEAASIDAVPAEQPLQQTSLNLVLKGILADQATSNRLALIAAGGQKEKVYRTGDKVEGADIIRIEPRRVVIRRNGVTEALDLEVRKLAGAAGSKKTANRIVTTGLVRAISDTERVIPQAVFKKQLSNLPALLQQASAVPHIDDGEQAGFRIVSINQGSLFEQLGIRRDDIIYAVNEMPVRNVGDAMDAYRNLSRSSTFRVGVIRDGEDLTLNLSVQ